MIYAERAVILMYNPQLETFLRVADAGRGVGREGLPGSGVKPAHSMEQADQPLLHGIVKIEAGGSAFRRTLADGRHHAGDQCGKRVLVPLLCAGGQILIE